MDLESRTVLKQGCFNSVLVVLSTCEETMKIRIAAGEHKGRYVGQNFYGLRTNPELLASPEVKLPGTPYSLFTQEQVANNYLDEKARQVQTELKALGLESELV